MALYRTKAAGDKDADSRHVGDGHSARDSSGARLLLGEHAGEVPP